ncbi:hypothetical protein DER30_0088 [Streptomyces sp. HB202]|nr:hypothetical protein DER30_0088 [Streptomyces sp. HB202]
MEGGRRPVAPSVRSLTDPQGDDPCRPDPGEPGRGRDRLAEQAGEWVSRRACCPSPTPRSSFGSVPTVVPPCRDRGAGPGPRSGHQERGSHGTHRDRGEGVMGAGAQPGYGMATRNVCRRTATRGHGIRVGIEVPARLPDGRPAAGNLDLFHAACDLLRRTGDAACPVQPSLARVATRRDVLRPAGQDIAFSEPALANSPRERGAFSPTPRFDRQGVDRLARSAPVRKNVRRWNRPLSGLGGSRRASWNTGELTGASATGGRTSRARGGRACPGRIGSRSV